MTVEKMGKDFVEKEMKGALGFKIIPTEIRIKQKLSQNRDENNFKKIIENLEKSDYPMDKIMAQKMKKIKL
jgi:transcriptional regulator